ncbi:MAG TPA: DUF222 domain-containing protein [Propionibacteriaceae bacterium]|nr:DUF222 domain-containing protein [Propionibacteriaceae bacterium]
MRLDGEPARLLGAVDAAAGDLLTGDLVGALRDLEDLKNMATALQAVAAVAFDREQRAEQARRGVPADQLGRGIAEQVALARRESPARGAVFLGVATALVAGMPRTLDAMAAGVLSEHRAQILVHETTCVSPRVRAQVDEVVAGDLGRLSRLGTRRLADLARGETYRRDPAAVVARIGHAASERFVSLRPAPDCMTRLTALLPVAQGVAVLAALHHTAQTGRLGGDRRTRAQIMADELVVRVTGQTSPDAVPVALHLVMAADTLLTGGDRPGRVHGHGPIPAPLARRLVLAAPAVASWVRKLYTTPKGGLVAMESGSRFFPDGLAEFITLRDQYCRTPYCDAQLRHIDHIIPHSAGGRTTVTNAQGLCERCNHAKQAPGWNHAVLLKEQPDHDSDTGQPRIGEPHIGEPPIGEALEIREVLVTTPTGHHYTSPTPDP